MKSKLFTAAALLGLSAAASAQTVNVICSVQAEWCNVISTVYARTTGVRINMAGREVFKVAVKTLDSLVDETLQAAGMDESQIDWLIPHQANLRIIEATAKRLKMPMEQVIVTVQEHANTSSGSVPLALDYAVRSGKVKRGQNLLLEAFGGGFTWASALLRY